MLSIQGMNYLTSGDVPGLLGNTHPNIVPYQVFPTANGNIIVAEWVHTGRITRLRKLS